jgi:hypothetical protein
MINRSDTTPVIAEARGKARNFIRHASAEDDLRFSLLNGLRQEVQQRITGQSLE